MRTIILLSGYSGCGKDFFFQNLSNIEHFYKINPSYQSLFKKDYHRYAFADIIKESLGIPIERRLTLEERLLVIKEAGNFKEIKGENYFAKKLCKVLEKTDKNIMITDFRFPIEYETITSNFTMDDIITIRLEGDCKFDDKTEKMLEDFHFDFRLERV